MKRSKNRDCYCGPLDAGSEMLSKEGLPPGFCAKCSICGNPGHLRHAPGCHPYTDGWCDKCYVVQSVINNVQCLSLPLFVAALVFRTWRVAILATVSFIFPVFLNGIGKKYVQKIMRTE